jgi:hypothetical protein
MSLSKYNRFEVKWIFLDASGQGSDAQYILCGRQVSRTCNCFHLIQKAADVQNKRSHKR